MQPSSPSRRMTWPMYSFLITKWSPIFNIASPLFSVAFQAVNVRLSVQFSGRDPLLFRLPSGALVTEAHRPTIESLLLCFLFAIRFDLSVDRDRHVPVNGELSHGSNLLRSTGSG